MLWFYPQGYEDDDSSVEMTKPRHGSTSSKGSKASATMGTTEKNKSEKEEGAKDGEGEYADDFEGEEKTEGKKLSKCWYMKRLTISFT